MLYKKPKPEFETLEELKSNTIQQVDNLVREVIFLKEDDLPILNFYYKTLFPDIHSFIFHTGVGFNKISELEPNLLREEYWVISNHGYFGSIKPPNQSYNEEVLNKYLNHIIVTSNFNNIQYVDKEDWTIPINFDNRVYNYTTRFISSFDVDVYKSYIESKLKYLYDRKDLERIITYIYDDKRNRKNVTRLINTFAERHKFDLSVTLSNMEKDYTYEINGLMRKILLKESSSNWINVIASLLKDFNEHYVITVLQNNIELAKKLKFKENIRKSDEFKVRYMKTYIDDVDLLDFVYLYNIVNKKEDFRIKLYKIKKYMENDMRELIINHRGGL